MGEPWSFLWLLVGDVHRFAVAHGSWMTWNLFLAAVPVLLAAGLFAGPRRHGPAWWVGVAVFVLFLPNAPYVLTDVVHLFDDIRAARSDLQVLGLFLPLYGLYAAVGFAAYVVCLDAARRHLRAAGHGDRWPGLEVLLHALCAVGIYLGRVVRLNSWNVFTRPRAVLGAVAQLNGFLPLAIVAVTVAVLAVGTALTRPLLRAGVGRIGRVAKRIGVVPG